MKIKNISNRTIMKNNLIFWELFATEKIKFFDPLMQIRKDFLLPKLKDIKQWSNAFINNDMNQAWIQISKWVLDVKVKRESFIKNLTRERKQELFNKIATIITDNKMGKEWTYSLMDFVISGFFMPPIYNLRIVSDENKKELNIRLNPTTSLEDIKEAWGSIEKAKVKLFGEVQRKYFTKKQIDNFILYAKHKELKESKNKLSDRELPSKKYVATDIDIVGQLFDKDTDDSAKSDKKRLNRIRQIKSRLEKKLQA